MNNFRMIQQNYDMGFITPMEFVSQWGAELNIRHIEFSEVLKFKIQAILDEANKKMAEVAKEIEQCQNFLTQADFD